MKIRARPEVNTSNTKIIGGSLKQVCRIRLLYDNGQLPSNRFPVRASDTKSPPINAKAFGSFYVRVYTTMLLRIDIRKEQEVPMLINAPGG